MLAPRSLRLTIDPTGRMVRQSASTPPVEALAHAIREVEQRAGESRRTLLSNLTPVHVEAMQGALQAARMSGMPHHSGTARVPVRHNAKAQTLFLARGDCYMIRVHASGVSAVTYVSLDYGIAPTLATTDAALTLRSPLDSILAELNGARLLAVVLDRELTPIEQHIAATTMPSVWRQHGGPPVAVVTAPTTEDIEVCYRFCELFSDPKGRLEQLGSQSPEWSVALAAHIHRDDQVGSADQGQDYSRGVSGVAVKHFAAIPIMGKIEKQAKQSTRPGNPALLDAFDVRGSRAVNGVGVSRAVEDVSRSRPMDRIPPGVPPVPTIPLKDSPLSNVGEQHAVPAHAAHTERPVMVTPSAAVDVAVVGSQAVSGVGVSRAVEDFDVAVAATNHQEKMTDTEEETQARPKPRMRF